MSSTRRKPGRRRRSAVFLPDDMTTSFLVVRRRGLFKTSWRRLKDFCVRWERYTKTLCTWFLPAIHKIYWANLIKGCSQFVWFKLYYNWPDFLLWVSVKDGLTNIMYPISFVSNLTPIAITTPFNIFYNINIIFIILNPMGTYTQTTATCSLLSHVVSSFWSALSCIEILDWSSIIFAFCSSNFSLNLFIKGDVQEDCRECSQF